MKALTDNRLEIPGKQIPMSQRHFSRKTSWRRTGPIVAAVAGSLLAGAAFLVGSSPFSALAIAGLGAAIVFGIGSVRRPSWALYLAILVTFIPAGLLPNSVHSLMNRGSVVLALGLWLLDVIARRQRIVWTGALIFMLGFIGWSIVTLLWAGRASSGIERLAQYATRTILFLLLVTNEIDTRDGVNALMNVLACSAWILVIAGIFAVMTQGYQTKTGVQVLDTNINNYAVHLLMTMPGVLWQALRTDGSEKSLLVALSFVFIASAASLVALGGSRGGSISFIVILLLFWLWKPTQLWGRLGIVILVVAIAATPFLFSTLVYRFTASAGGSLGGRVPIWQATWDLINDHLFVGVGIGNANEAILPYLGLLVSIMGRVERSSHSPVLQIWAETGLIGLTLYIGVLVSAIVTFVRCYLRSRRTNEKYLIRYFALVSCVCGGALISWNIGGGMEYDPSYFLLLALLLIPANLVPQAVPDISIDDHTLVGAGTDDDG